MPKAGCICALIRNSSRPCIRLRPGTDAEFAYKRIKGGIVAERKGALSLENKKQGCAVEQNCSIYIFRDAENRRLARRFGN